MKRVSNHRMNTKAKKLGEKRVNPTRNAEHNATSDYRRIFESAQYGILIIHAKTGRIEDANHYILDLLGYSLNELVRKTVWQLHSDPEKARQRFEKMLEKGIDHWDNLPLASANGSMAPVDINCSVYQAGRKKLVRIRYRIFLMRLMLRAMRFS
jgi:PAS domain S-box-containing protein